MKDEKFIKMWKEHHIKGERKFTKYRTKSLYIPLCTSFLSTFVIAKLNKTFSNNEFIFLFIFTLILTVFLVFIVRITSPMVFRENEKRYKKLTYINKNT